MHNQKLKTPIMLAKVVVKGKHSHYKLFQWLKSLVFTF